MYCVIRLYVLLYIYIYIKPIQLKNVHEIFSLLNMLIQPVTEYVH